MLLIVCAPAAAAVRPITTTKSTVLAKVVLMTSGALVSQSTKTTVLVALTALQLVKMARVTTETLLLRQASLAPLALRVVRSRSGTARLSPKGGRTRSAALAVPERLQGILAGNLLANLLLAVGALTSVATLGLAVRVRNAAECARASRSIVLVLSCT